MHWHTTTPRSGGVALADADAEGRGDDNPVVLVQYANNCAQAITCPIVPVIASDEAFERSSSCGAVCHCVSALTGKESKETVVYMFSIFSIWLM